MDTAASAVPQERTLALVNTYVVHTATMLNAFSVSCEQYLSKVHGVHMPRSPRASFVTTVGSCVLDGGGDPSECHIRVRCCCPCQQSISSSFRV